MVNKKTYAVSELADVGIDTRKIHQRENVNEIYFKGLLSPLSNFHPCKIVSDGTEFNSAEHMYQYLRAKRHSDSKAMGSILLCNQAKTAKQAGKLTHVPENIDQGGENRALTEIMRHVVKCKFQQNPSLKKALMDTGSKTLIEANKHDKVWGSGVDLFDRDLFKKPCVLHRKA